MVLGLLCVGVAWAKAQTDGNTTATAPADNTTTAALAGNDTAAAGNGTATPGNATATPGNTTAEAKPMAVVLSGDETLDLLTVRAKAKEVTGVPLADPDGRKQKALELLAVTDAFLAQHPQNVEVLLIQGAAAVELDRQGEGAQAGLALKELLASAPADQQEKMTKVLVALNAKGWLAPEFLAKQKKLGELMATAQANDHADGWTKALAALDEAVALDASYAPAVALRQKVFEEVTKQKAEEAKKQADVEATQVLALAQNTTWWLDQAAAQTPDIDWKPSRASAECFLAGDLAQAGLYERAMQVAAKIDPPAGQAQDDHARRFIARAQFGNGQTAAAEATAAAIKDVWVRAQAYQAMAYDSHQKGDQKAATHYMKDMYLPTMKQWLQTTSEPDEQATIMTRMVQAYYECGFPDEGSDWLDRAASKARQEKADVQVYAYASIADSLATVGQYEQAVAYAKKMFDLSIITPDVVEGCWKYIATQQYLAGNPGYATTLQEGRDGIDANTERFHSFSDLGGGAQMIGDDVPAEARVTLMAKNGDPEGAEKLFRDEKLSARFNNNAFEAVLDKYAEQGKPEAVKAFIEYATSLTDDMTDHDVAYTRAYCLGRVPLAYVYKGDWPAAVQYIKAQTEALARYQGYAALAEYLTKKSKAAAEKKPGTPANG